MQLAEPPVLTSADRLERDTTSLKNDIYSAYRDFLSGTKLDVGRRFHDLSIPKVVDRIEHLKR
jgi:N-acetyl-beta-hexosaminidase